MSQKLLDLNEDLRRLRDAGYNVSVDGAYLIVREVPYVNANREVHRGVLVSNLDLDGEKTIAPASHVIRFAGQHPHGADGGALVGISVNRDETQLTQRLKVQFNFSSTPPNRGYHDYYEKMTTYVAILSTPAATIEPWRNGPHLRGSGAICGRVAF